MDTLTKYPLQAYAYIKNQPWLRNALIALLLLLLGYGTGRYLAPSKVVIQDHVVTVEKEVVVTQVQTQIKVVKVVDTSSDRKVHRTTTETTKPDGTKVETTTEDIDAAKTSHEADDTNKSQQANSTSTTDKKIDSTHTEVKITERPGWHMGVDLGLNLSHMIGNDPNVGIPGLRGAVVGVHAEHRVIGPLFLGLFGNSMGAAGLSVSAEF